MDGRAREAVAVAARFVGAALVGAGRPRSRRSAPRSQSRGTAADAYPSGGRVAGLPRPPAWSVLFGGATGQPCLGRAGTFGGAASHLRRPSATSPGDHGGPRPPGQRTAPRLWAGVHSVTSPLPRRHNGDTLN